MSEAIGISDVFNEIKALRKDVEYIKENMIDPDFIMTDEESIRFDESLKDLKTGKTTSLSDLKKELGL